MVPVAGEVVIVVVVVAPVGSVRVVVVELGTVVVVVELDGVVVVVKPLVWVEVGLACVSVVVFPGSGVPLACMEKPKVLAEAP